MTPIIIGRKHETNCQRSLGICISTRWASSWQLHLVCVQPLNSSVKSSFRAILTTILLPVQRGCFFVTRFATRRVGWLFSAGFRVSPSGSYPEGRRFKSYPRNQKFPHINTLYPSKSSDLRGFLHLAPFFCYPFCYLPSGFFIFCV